MHVGAIAAGRRAGGLLDCRAPVPEAIDSDADARTTWPLQLRAIDESTLAAFARALGQQLRQRPAVTEAGAALLLSGPMGAGKTTFTRALLRFCGETGPVKSPTYTLVEVHEVSGINFYHFDFYRFSQPEEYLDAGLDEYFSGNGVCLVEWPDKALPYLPPPDLELELRHGSGDSERIACLRAHSEQGGACLSAMSAAASLATPPAR